MRLIDDLDVELLEPVLRQLIDLIGFEATMRLVEHCGGTRVSVPRQADQNARLVGLIGAEKAAVLGRAMSADGIERILVPKATKAMLAARNRRIVGELQVASVAETARRWKLSERSVYYIQAQHDSPAAQPTASLFD